MPAQPRPRLVGRMSVHSPLDGSPSGPPTVAKWIGDSEWKTAALPGTCFPPAFLTCPAVDTARSASLPGLLSSAHMLKPNREKDREPPRWPPGTSHPPGFPKGAEVRGRKEERGRWRVFRPEAVFGSGPWTEAPPTPPPAPSSWESGQQVALSHPQEGPRAEPPPGTSQAGSPAAEQGPQGRPPSRSLMEHWDAGDKAALAKRQA